MKANSDLHLSVTRYGKRVFTKDMKIGEHYVTVKGFYYEGEYYIELWKDGYLLTFNCLD